MTALKAAGMTFAGRYVSSQAGNDANGKNLLPGEQKELHAGGLKIILFCGEDWDAPMPKDMTCWVG